MEADGSDVKRLTDNPATDISPAWSPDRTQLLFVSDRSGNFEIMLMNSDGSGVTALTSTGWTSGGPAWSPDGQKIVYTTWPPGELAEIYIMDNDGTNPVRLTNDPDMDGGASWAPDGSQLLFTSNRSGDWEIYRMNPDGSAQTRLTNGSEVQGTPRFSPDGSRIVYYSPGLGGQTGIYLSDADGSNPVLITGQDDSEPSWSRDGQVIFFSSFRDGNMEVYRMSRDGSDQRRLTDNGTVDGSPMGRRQRPVTGTGRGE